MLPGILSDSRRLSNVFDTLSSTLSGILCGKQPSTEISIPSWHSIWPIWHTRQIAWHSIPHPFRRSIWHFKSRIPWHCTWHSFRPSIWQFIWQPAHQVTPHYIILKALLSVWLTMLIFPKPRPYRCSHRLLEHAWVRGNLEVVKILEVHGVRRDFVGLEGPEVPIFILRGVPQANDIWYDLIWWDVHAWNRPIINRRTGAQTYTHIWIYTCAWMYLATHMHQNPPRRPASRCHRLGG